MRDCRGCDKREIGCHSKCEIYKSNKERRDAKRESVAKERNREGEYIAYLARQKQRG